MDVVGVVGTWVAVLFAIIALLGIVGPFLVLQQTRSERFQALAAIDNPNYVTKGFTPRKGFSFFRKGKVPYLYDPPRFRRKPQPHFFAISTFKDSNGSRIGQTTSSSTGWVNFASTFELYEPSLAKGDHLVFFGKQAWLPVHRFWILAFGLRGRFADRRDKGKANSTGNATRLRIEGYQAEDRDVAYASGPLQGRLYGFTGILWWKVSGYNNADPDEVYFALHPKEDRQLSLVPDPMPLSTLFWLSLGCLPLSNDPRNRVFDLAGFLSANQFIHPRDDYDNNENRRKAPVKFYRFSKRRDFKGYQSLGNIGIGGYSSTNLTFPEAGQSPTSSPGDGTSREWADAMGVDLTQIWCMNRCRRPKDSRAELAKGLWWSVPDLQGYIWRSDMQLQALALLRLPLSPLGFLFDHERTSGHDPTSLRLGTIYANCRVFKGSWSNTCHLRHQMKGTSFTTGLSKQEREAIERLWSCWPSQRAAQARPAFGRNRTRISYELDAHILSNRSALPMAVQDIIGILTMTSNDNLDKRTTDSSVKEPTSQTGNEFLDLLIHCMSDSASANSCYLEVDVTANLVQISCSSCTILKTSMIFKELFADEHYYENISGRYQNFTEFVLLTLKALIRGVMLETAVDSNQLLNLVEKMTDVVNVSAKSRPPPLETAQRPWLRGEWPGQDDILGSSRHDDDSDDESTHRSGSESDIDVHISRQNGGHDHQTSGARSQNDDDDNSQMELRDLHDLYNSLQADSLQTNMDLQLRSQVRLAEHIRDLQYKLNSLQVDFVAKLDSVGRITAARPSKPSNNAHVETGEGEPGDFIISIDSIEPAERQLSPNVKSDAQEST